MADYAGAVAAIKALLLEADKPIPADRIGYINESDPVQVDENGNPAMWAEFEVTSLGSNVIGHGTPGNHVIVYDGLIKVYVFNETGTGVEAGNTAAVAFGEIFKNLVFYDTVTDGCYVRTGYPSIEDGNAASDDGLWFGTTASIPFQYWHRG